MKILKKGESQEKSTNVGVEESLAICVHATVHPSLNAGERFQMTWNVDFRDITDEQIMEAAAEHFIIKIRRTFAKIKKPANDDWNNVTFQAKDYISVRTSKTEKIANDLGVSKEDLLAALESIKAAK